MVLSIVSMKHRRLGRASLVVSEICMGTMTFGSYCDEEESFAIMDKAFEHGIDFFDTAELYPVPPMKKWAYHTEEIVGRWMQTKSRDSMIIATKVAGPGHGWFRPPIREGKTGLDRHHIRKAVEGSLRRLQTDYIDLYQTHWPDHGYAYEETLAVLDELVQEGKLRYYGCCNENAWGLMKSLWAADQHGLQRFDSIQNNFSILCRRSELDIAEVCRKEGIAMLPYSPLAGGVLTGKYNAANPPGDARFSVYFKGKERQKRIAKKYLNERSLAATKELMDLAARNDMSVTTLSVAWSKQHDYVASTIIGATSVQQLDDSLKAADLKLETETMQAIEEISLKYHGAVQDM